MDGLASCGTLACSSCGGRSGACCWGSGVSHCVWWPGAVMRHLSVVDGGVLIRVVVENCIVDASILIFLCLVRCASC